MEPITRDTLVEKIMDIARGHILLCEKRGVAFHLFRRLSVQPGPPSGRPGRARSRRLHRRLKRLPRRAAVTIRRITTCRGSCP